ncbi:MAG: hypothetical protein DRP42_00355 [Tenericutes bacterium]|nr:MAG: hypothetical protein DRP42_00355 [Mycoplasmatota bacterium]
MISQFTGPSSFLFIDGEDQSSLKILEKEISANKNLTFKAGYVDGEYYDAEKIAELAALPSKDVLLSMLLSALQGTIRNLAYAISMVAEKAPADSTPVEPAKEEAKEEPTVETTEETKETTEEVVTPEVEESTEETITNKEESKDSEEKGE